MEEIIIGKVIGAVSPILALQEQVKLQAVELRQQRQLIEDQMTQIGVLKAEIQVLELNLEREKKKVTELESKARPSFQQAPVLRR